MKAWGYKNHFDSVSHFKVEEKKPFLCKFHFSKWKTGIDFLDCQSKKKKKCSIWSKNIRKGLLKSIRYHPFFIIDKEKKSKRWRWIDAIVDLDGCTVLCTYILHGQFELKYKAAIKAVGIWKKYSNLFEFLHVQIFITFMYRVRTLGQFI